MTPDPSSRSGRQRGPWQVLVAALVTGLCVSGLGVLISGAVFTDTTTNPNNLFSTGTVRLTTTPASTAMTMTGMSPGDVRYGRLVVQNSGSLSLRYAMSTTATDDAATTGDDRTLAAALQVGIRVVAAGATCDSSTYAASTSTVATRSTPQPLGGTAETPVIGDKAQGAQSGDRTLAASASEPLCFQVTLPTSTGDTVQGMSTTVTFGFFGEQTSNNP